MEFLPGDLIFVHGHSAIGAAIRTAETGPGEPVAYANHVAGFTSPSDVTEALWHVQTLPFPSWQTTTPIYQVWRCMALTPEQRSIVAQAASAYVGRPYGWWKLALHLGDSLLSWSIGTEVYAFRRMMSDGRYPICSWVWAYAYDALGLPNFFGLPPSEAQPEDMYDHVSCSILWEKVYESTGGVA